ncbi:MAG TPA: hypothetical protein CFH79_01335 [Sulfurospirillum sp. UBA11407]|nr:MAG TPA: hypothetical protein CFH79_01335 [Sulfurospirillum sp. UBA11407]
MGKAKFIDKIKTLFGYEIPEDKTNKTVVKELVEKLKIKRIDLKKELKSETDIIHREALKDSLKILKKQIKKGEDLLKE